ncbi:MAG TPA: hypothetical protein VK927_00180 [Adhaeribacter sp.]|nr:hypothetical protein [Adhaeribacter sp.]
MSGEVNSIAEYLSYQEAFRLGERLSEAEIPFWAKTCGPPAIPFAEGTFYRLLVSAENTEAATAIAAKFLQERDAALKQVKCPRCRSEAVLPAKSLPFWQKIYYAGTEVFTCQNCGKKFSR